MVAAVLAGQAGGVEAPPLKPLGAWNVEYADTMCILSRTYVDASAPITIGFKPTPLSDILQAVVLGTGRQLGRPRSVDITLTAPARNFGEKLRGDRLRYPKSDRTILIYDVPRETLDALPGARELTIRASDGPPLTVALSMGQATLAALRTCENDLLKHLGFDPVKIAAVVTPARSDSPAEWITNDDYPVSALTGGRQGTSYIGWTISTEGRVTECKILLSSGTAALDQAACGAVMKRGRAKPALDAAGKPVESYSTRRVRWQLPG